MARKWTLKEDRAWDRAHGIKEGSQRDIALDRARGVPEPTKGAGVAKRPSRVKASQRALGAMSPRAAARAIGKAR
ncbi:MAG: hypothetical protein J2P50_18585, partial [Hyphomicrobiaceae bacterium]|nr:hypothetical protein [Hyphomicrobiaceae bacterium]